MKRILLVLTILALACAPAAVAQPARPELVPVPPIRTALGTLPGVRELPVQPGLPDVLVTAGGRRVTTAGEWKQRREEMKRVLSYYAVGLMPPSPGNVTGREIASKRVRAGTVSYRLVHLSFGPGRRLGFDVAIFTPANRKGPFPTVIFPAGSTPGATPLPTLVRPPEQGKGLDAMTVPLGDQAPRVAAARAAAPSGAPAFVPPPSDPESAAAAHAALFDRGYALVTYNYQDTGEDTIGRNVDGDWAYRTTRFFPAYRGYDWGLVGAWAWGISRVIDYVEQQPFADPKMIVATGHSRLGKAVLVAGAFDDRIAVVAPAGSGAGGTGAYRFNGAEHGGREGLADEVRKYPNWFSPRLREFSGQAERLPFDQHWFIALAAPRAFISLEGSDDQNCEVTATQQAFAGAAPAFALLWASSRLGVNYAPHRHAFAPDDWSALLDFADRHLRGVQGPRRFDAFPPPSTPLPPSPLDASWQKWAASARAWNVRDLGATGDGRTKDTAAFQAAIDRCAEAGGGIVAVPPGDYVVGSLVLRSNTTLRLAHHATLYGSPDLDDYPATKVRWEGRWVDGRRALLSARDAQRVAVVGPGRIVGSPAMGTRRMPYRAVVFEAVECRDVLLEGFEVEQASMWAIHPTYCENVAARRLTIRSTGGDGIDVDSCRHVVIDSCDIDVGDDAIAIKSGRGMEGYVIARPTEDVLVTNCTLGDHHFACIGIGSETSGGIRGVRIEHCRFTHAKTFAIYIKSRPGRGASIEDISGRDLDVSNAEGFLRFNLTNSGLQDPEPVPGDAGIPATRHLRFEDVRVDGGTLVEGAAVPAEKPIEGLSIVNVTGRCDKGMTLANIRDIELRDIRVTGVQGPLVTATNVTGTGLEGQPAARK